MLQAINILSLDIGWPGLSFEFGLSGLASRLDYNIIVGLNVSPKGPSPLVGESDVSGESDLSGVATHLFNT
jgi:hypothetical protein